MFETLNVKVCLGRELLKTANVQIPWADIEYGQEHLSEHEVLDMVGHDRHYRATSPALLPVPAPHVSPPKPGKIARHRSSSKDVVGNIGEGIGIAALLSMGNSHPHHVCRVRRSREGVGVDQGRRMPDYVVSLPSPLDGFALLSQVLARVGVTPVEMQTHSLVTFPQRFPVETKASSGTGTAYWSGLWQLIEYWHSVLVTDPSGGVTAGYGILIQTTGVRSANRAINFHIFAPKQGANLSKLGKLPPQRAATKAEFEKHFGMTWPFLGDM